jgi:large subunit ribosomal protein L17
MKTFAGRKLTRTSGHRECLLRNLTSALLQHEKIQTTFPKAKELSRYAEKIISMAKKEGLSAQRQVAKFVHEREIRKKLFDVLVPRYQSRDGGYTQIMRSGQRTGDAAQMAVIRLLP